MIRAIARRVFRGRTAVLLAAGLAAGPGCRGGGDPGGSPAEGEARAPAPESSLERDLRALAEALEKAPTVDRLRADFVAELPKPEASDAEALRARATDPEADAAARTAARIALGALADAERTQALRHWMNEAIKLLPAGARGSSAEVVRLLTTLHAPLAEARGRLPAALAAALPPASPGERMAWTRSMAELPAAQPEAGDAPLLMRLALFAQAASPRLALLMMAPVDAPAVTEALATMPRSDMGDPEGLSLTWWALALHATTPGGRARLRALTGAAGRTGDRATAVLTWLGDDAVRGAAAKLIDRLAEQTDDALDFDRRTFVEGAGRLAEGEDAEGVLATALARYGGSHAPLARRARVLAGAAGVAADRDALFEAVTADPVDPRARGMLLPLLRAQDAERVAALLARERWGLKGFYHHVRMVQQAPAEVVAPVVATALEAVAAEHPKPQTREWALGALAKAGGPLPRVVVEAAAKGSKAGTRTLVMRADDPWGALWTRISGDDDAVRRAAYEVLIAPRLLPFDPTPAQAAQILGQIAAHLTHRPEDPWLFLRATRRYVDLAGEARTPALEKALVRSLRPYCVTTGPDGKPWWDALLAVARMDHPDARALLRDAVKSVPTAGGRAVLRQRVGLPPDPKDAPPTPEAQPKRGGHWSNPAAPGGGR